LRFVLLPFFNLRSNKKARAGFPVRACYFCFYFQTSKLEGVNPPNFELYISMRISGLRENKWFKGLDKISAAGRFSEFLSPA